MCLMQKLTYDLGFLVILHSIVSNIEIADETGYAKRQFLDIFQATIEQIYTVIYFLKLML